VEGGGRDPDVRSFAAWLQPALDAGQLADQREIGLVLFAGRT
jgi:hypothetical protein